MSRIKQGRQANYETSRELAVFAVDQAQYNLGQMISHISEGTGGMHRTGNQAELRELVRLCNKIKDGLGANGRKYTL